LIAQALILALVTGMHITVGIDLLRLCRHRADLLIRRRSRYMPDRKAALGWNKDAIELFSASTRFHGASRAFGGTPARHCRSAPVHPHHAALRQADVGAHDELRAARLGHR